MNPRIDTARCTGCGLCVRSCPTEVLRLGNGKAEAHGSRCIRCGHCAAVCPADAIAGALPDRPATPFETFAPAATPVPPGKTDLAELVRLLASRRSVRRFTSRPVDPQVLRDLVRIGITAPSATNCQSWTFNILPDPDAVLALSRRVAKVYRQLAWFSDWTLLRTVLRWVGKPDLADFHRRYRTFITDRLDAWEQGAASDPFFRGAPCALIVGARPTGTMHSDDAHMATQNILLAAHAMGLGTCLVGLALVAFRLDRSIAPALGLPRDELIHSIVAIGYPDENFLRFTGRAEPEIRILRPQP